MNKESSVIRVLIATLPLLAYTLSLQEAVIVGAGVAFVFCVTGLFLKATAPLFPRGFLGFVVILWLAVLAHAAWYLFGLPPLWVASALLLQPFSVNRKEGRRLTGRYTQVEMVPRDYRAIVWRGVGFWIVVTYLGAVQEFFSEGLSIWLFRSPAGALFLLAFAAWLWKNQPAPSRD